MRAGDGDSRALTTPAVVVLVRVDTNDE